MYAGNGFAGGRDADRRREAGERSAAQEKEHDLIALSETTPSCSDTSTASWSRCGSKTSQATSACSASSPPRHSPGPSRARRCAIGIRLRQPRSGRDSGGIRSCEAGRDCREPGGGKSGNGKRAKVYKALMESCLTDESCKPNPTGHGPHGVFRILTELDEHAIHGSGTLPVVFIAYETGGQKRFIGPIANGQQQKGFLWYGIRTGNQRALDRMPEIFHGQSGTRQILPGSSNARIVLDAQAQSCPIAPASRLRRRDAQDLKFRRSPCACGRGIGRSLTRYSDCHHLPQAVGVETDVIA